jgi:hypothetical protein
MGVPYEIPPKAGIAATGTPIVEVIDWPDRSVISKIVVVQTEGVMEAFTVALYNHPQVEDGVQVSDSVGGEVGKIPDDCFRVTPDLVAGAGGKLLYFSDEATGGYGYVFYGQKAKDGRQGQRASKLYVKITPTSGGAKKYALCIGGMKEVE